MTFTRKILPSTCFLNKNRGTYHRECLKICHIWLQTLGRMLKIGSAACTQFNIIMKEVIKTMQEVENLLDNLGSIGSETDLAKIANMPIFSDLSLSVQDSCGHSAHSVQVFLENMQTFRHHCEQVAKRCRHGKRWRLAQSMEAAFQQRSLQVLRMMWQNLLEQIHLGNQYNSSPRYSRTECSSSDSTGDEVELAEDDGARPIDKLLGGNTKAALALVPSRELARKLGVSDQKLRREIYLARQRALQTDHNKRQRLIHVPINPSRSPVAMAVSDENMCPIHTDIYLSTTSNHAALIVENIIDDWMDVNTWLCSDIFEN